MPEPPEAAADARLPNFLIAGAPRCGTTTLYHHLRRHPQVFLSPEKETFFFTSDGWDGTTPDAGELQAYRELFADAGDAPVVGEATPTYLAHPDALPRIQALLGDVRALVSLRDPVERAFSHYLLQRRSGAEEAPLAEVLDDVAGPDDASRWSFLRQSMYAGDLRRWRKALGPDHVHVVLLADLKADPRTTLGDVAAFLDIDPAPFDAMDTDQVLHSYGKPRSALAKRIRNDARIVNLARAVFPEAFRRWVDDTFLFEKKAKPTLADGDRGRLQELFAPDLDELEALLGRDLPALRASWI